MLTLPDALRHELKDPVGPLYTDAERLLADAGRPVIAVGDVVTEHLLRETVPHVALVDGQTKRTALDERVDLAAFDRRMTVENPAAELSEALLAALGTAIRGTGTTAIEVDGEEDLAALPAIVAAPDGAAVVYGQPNEGMVLATVDGDLRTRMRDLLSRFDGDPAAAFAALGV